MELGCAGLAGRRAGLGPRGAWQHLVNWQSGAASSSARRWEGVEATFRLLACQSRISAS